MEDSYNVGDIIILENKEYCIIKEYNGYYVVVSLDTPLDIKVGKFYQNTFSSENNKEIIKEVLTSK